MRPASETTPFSGRQRLLESDGSEIEASEARFEILPDALLVQPAQGALLRVDFADVDGVESGDYLTRLALESGERVEASMLGRRSDEFAEVLTGRLRDYQAKHLLLEEPVGGEGFACDFEWDGEPGSGEVRVYATRLAVVARERTPFPVPFGEVRGLAFDESRYALDLELPGGRLALLRMGKRTQPCLRLLETRLAELRARTAAALAHLAPGLPILAARKLGQALPDGVPAPRARLDAIADGLWERLVAAAVADPGLRASVESLAARCPADLVAVGLKETHARQDGDPAEDEPEEPTGDAPGQPDEEYEAAGALQEGGEDPMSGRVAWFLFPVIAEDRSLPGNAVAVEVASRAGRATYLFRIAPPQVYREAPFAELRELAVERVRAVSRALVAVGFKREPIYLPEDRLRSGRHARYRLALRLSPALRAARATFVGRAIHGKGWEAQIDAALARARG